MSRVLSREPKGGSANAHQPYYGPESNSDYLRDNLTSCLSSSSSSSSNNNRKGKTGRTKDHKEFSRHHTNDTISNHTR
jgi:hypothetical protein